MSIIDQLATSLHRRDEVPNQDLAKRIADTNDQKAVKELAALLHHKNKDIQHDAIKVLYEIGVLKPAMIAGYAGEFVALLDHQNNRLQWGGMTALNAITDEEPDMIYKALPKIISAADKGSVITNDHCFAILVKLCSIKKYAKDAFELLNERLMKSPVNQLPMYAENALPIIGDAYRTTFIKTLTSRLGEIEKDSKRLRVEKVIKKAGK